MTKKKIKQKTTRGEIAITPRNGILYLRIPYQGKRRMLSTGYSDNSYHRIKANELKIRIEKDLVSDNFDETLEKYKVKKKAVLSTVQLFNSFITYHRKQGTSEHSISCRFIPLLSNLKTFNKDITNAEIAKEFMAMLRVNQSTDTANRNQGLMQDFCQWANIEPNPFANLAKPKANTDRRKPFLPSERDSILNAFASHPTYCHYYPFAYTLFATGIRISEAIALQWKNINFATGVITVAESLSRPPSGKTSSKHRVRKGTKTNVVREVPITNGLRELLLSMGDRLPDALVFTTVTGLAIDDHTFSQRVWKQVVAEAQIPHRPPYSCRHTFASNLIEQGITTAQTAHLLGHKNMDMVSRVYGHALTTPQLPEI